MTEKEYRDRITKILTDDRRRRFGAKINTPDSDMVARIAHYHYASRQHGQNLPFDTSHIVYLYDYLLYEVVAQRYMP